MELNRIYNEDCMEGMKRIPDGSVDCVLTDIPYGKCSNRKEGGLRIINKGDADKVSFNLTELVQSVVKKTKQSAYIFCGTEQVSEIRRVMAESGMSTRLCIWEKTNPSPFAGQFMWLSSIECCVFGRFPKSTFNEFCKSAVWKCARGTSKIHPTQKPVELFRRLILASTNEGDIVLDPFMGSGTTAIACIREHRNYIGFELNKEYYEKSLNRIKEETSQPSLF